MLIGGSPVGSVESIELSDDNLAEVHVEVEPGAARGDDRGRFAPPRSRASPTTTSRSAPGPNSSPALGEGAELGLGSTTTPIDIDQFFNTFPPSVRKGLSNFIKGNSAIYAGQGPDRQRRLQVLRPGAQPHRRLRQGTERRPAPARPLHRQLQQALDHGRQRGEQLSSAISNANTAFSAIATQNVALDQTPAAPAAGDAPGQHDLRQPPRRPRRPRPAGRTRRSRRPRTWRRSWPNCGRSSPNSCPSPATCASPSAGPARRTTPANCWPCCRPCRNGRRRPFPHAEEAIAAFQPNLNFARAYTPDIFNGLGKIGQIAGYYDGNGHYVRAATAAQNLFAYEGGTLEPDHARRSSSTPSAPRPPVHRRCPGGATQSAPDGSNPFVDPPWSGSVNSSECNPADVPPGP